MGEKVTALDVAERAGVSRSAVSRVFTPGASVSERTAKKVRSAAEALGYRPNVLARSLITGRSRIVGLLVAYLENQFYPEAIERLIANDWADANRAEMAQGLNSVGILPAAYPPRTVYDELVSAGEFANIGSPDLRTAISAYHAQLTFLQGQIDYVRDLIEDPLQVGQPGARVVYVPGTERERRWQFDFDSLSQDEAFLQRLLLGNNLQRAVTGWTREALAAALTMCEALAEATRRPCQPPEAQSRLDRGAAPDAAEKDP